MATPPKYPPQPQPIANKDDSFKVDRTWLAFFNALAAQAAAAGSGSVTHTGSLTADHLILGNGGADIKALPAIGTANQVLHGNAFGAPTFGAVVEADQNLSDVTTANVSISAHGYTPKLPNDATKFLNGIGGYTVPSGSGGTVTTTGAPANGNLTKFSGATSVTNGDLSGDVTTSGTLATTLANTAVTPGTYGDSTHVAQVTFDAKGRATSATNVAIAGGGGGSSWIPLVNGAEPPVFITDGAGVLILVAYP